MVVAAALGAVFFGLIAAAIVDARLRERGIRRSRREQIRAAAAWIGFAALLIYFGAQFGGRP